MTDVVIIVVDVANVVFGFFLRFIHCERKGPYSLQKTSHSSSPKGMLLSTLLFQI